MVWGCTPVNRLAPISAFRPCEWYQDVMGSRSVLLDPDLEQAARVAWVATALEEQCQASLPLRSDAGSTGSGCSWVAPYHALWHQAAWRRSRRIQTRNWWWIVSVLLWAILQDTTETCCTPTSGPCTTRSRTSVHHWTQLPGVHEGGCGRRTVYDSTFLTSPEQVARTGVSKRYYRVDGSQKKRRKVKVKTSRDFSPTTKACVLMLCSATVLIELS